jgi:hypothetical protein
MSTKGSNQERNYHMVLTVLIMVFTLLILFSQLKLLYGNEKTYSVFNINNVSYAFVDNSDDFSSTIRDTK